MALGKILGWVMLTFGLLSLMIYVSIWLKIKIPFFKFSNLENYEKSFGKQGKALHFFRYVIFALVMGTLMILGIRK